MGTESAGDIDRPQAPDEPVDLEPQQDVAPEVGEGEASGADEPAAEEVGAEELKAEEETSES